MNEQSLSVRQGGHTTNRIPQKMNSNRSSKQGRGKAKAKNPPSKKNKALRAARPERSNGGQKSVAAAYATGQSGNSARVMQGKDSIRIVHREFLTNVTGSILFAVASSIALNPGLAASFPWLAGMAQNWETYRFRKLRFCYYTRTGSNVPGSVIMAHDPDASDAAPSTEQIMTTYEAVAEDAPWKDIHLDCRVSSLNDLGPRKFVRTSALAANQDIKLYDSGNLFLAAVDGTAVSWGKLWVEYDIELFTPQLPPLGTNTLAGGAIQGGGAFSAANPLGATPVVDAEAVGLATNATSLVTLTNAGTYLVSIHVAGTVITALTAVAVAGCTSVSIQNFLVNAAGTVANQTFRVIATTGGATLQFGSTATTITGSAVYLVEAPPSSLN